MLKKWINRVLGRTPASNAAPPSRAESMADRRARIATQLRIIPREDHAISRKLISPNALRVMYKLRDAGFHSYLVGGGVRDLMLGIEPKDFDIATDAHPEQVKQLFRNCRLIGRRFRLAHVHFGDEIIEVATFRGSESEDETEPGDRHVVDGRILRDNIYGSIEEDAIRRDFTANALYYAIDDFSVRDYVGGAADVKARVLRLIGDPVERYREDPVRMLRAARLAAKLDFKIEASAAKAIADLGQLVLSAAPARLFDECLKMFMSGHAQKSFEQLRALGLFRVLFPEVDAAIDQQAGMKRLLERGLASTDQRVAEDRPVTPAFLFAAMLWPWLQKERQRLQESRGAEALRLAADRVLDVQTKRIALPKRFTVSMLEIWLLQERLESSRKKRVGRLAAHPKFRAAYDFLLLRAEADLSLTPHVEYWRKLIEADSSESAESTGADDDQSDQAAPVAAHAETAPAKKRKRRRRRKKPAGAKVDQDS